MCLLQLHIHRTGVREKVIGRRQACSVDPNATQSCQSPFPGTTSALPHGNRGQDSSSLIQLSKELCRRFAAIEKRMARLIVPDRGQTSIVPSALFQNVSRPCSSHLWVSFSIAGHLFFSCILGLPWFPSRGWPSSSPVLYSVRFLRGDRRLFFAQALLSKHPPAPGGEVIQGQ